MTSILCIRVCVCLSCDHQRTLPQGTCVSSDNGVFCSRSISARPDRAHFAHHFTLVAEPTSVHALLLVRIAEWRDKFACVRRQQNLLTSTDCCISEMLLGEHTQARLGSCVFFAHAASLHEWQAHTRLRVAGKTCDHHVEAV